MDKSNDFGEKSLYDKDFFKVHEVEFQSLLSSAIPITKWKKNLLPHESDLLEKGLLQNITHKNSTSIWLEALSCPPSKGLTNVYRPMGDVEIIYWY